jgi:tRNA (guanine-N7-)-methyltransferase
MPGPVESEYGVPFPGEVLPRERWTRTGYRDREGAAVPFDWAGVFGRSAGRIVDLGCGNGRYLIASALARPGADHLGIDLVQRAVDWAAQRANRRGLANVRFAVGDVVAWMPRFEACSIDELHLYHPQPYYRDEDIARRLVTAAFLARAWSVLRPGGILVLQTDNKTYWSHIRRAVLRHFEPEIVSGPWPDAPLGRTRREIVARRRGLAVWRMVAHRLETPRDVDVPAPGFDANRPSFRRAKRRR